MAPRSTSLARQSGVEGRGVPMLRAYEIQRLSGTRWVLDSVSDEKDVAITVAKSLMQSGRAPGGVRVMAVQTKPDGDFSQITLYRCMPGEPPPAEPAPRPKAEAKAEPKPETVHRDFKHSDGPPPVPQKPKSGHLMLSLKIAFGVGFAVVAFELLRILSR